MKHPHLLPPSDPWKVSGTDVNVALLAEGEVLVKTGKLQDSHMAPHRGLRHRVEHLSMPLLELVSTADPDAARRAFDTAARLGDIRREAEVRQLRHRMRPMLRRAFWDGFRDPLRRPRRRQG